MRRLEGTDGRLWGRWNTQGGERGITWPSGRFQGGTQPMTSQDYQDRTLDGRSVGVLPSVLPRWPRLTWVDRYSTLGEALLVKRARAQRSAPLAPAESGSDPIRPGPGVSVTSLTPQARGFLLRPCTLALPGPGVHGRMIWNRDQRVGSEFLLPATRLRASLAARWCLEHTHSDLDYEGPGQRYAATSLPPLCADGVAFCCLSARRQRR